MTAPAQESSDGAPAGPRVRVHLQRIASFAWEDARVELREEGFGFKEAVLESLEPAFMVARVKSSGTLLLLPRRNTALNGFVVEEDEHTILLRVEHPPRELRVSRDAITLIEADSPRPRPALPVVPVDPTPTLAVGRRVRLQLRAADAFEWRTTSVQVSGRRTTIRNGVLESKRRGRLIVRPPTGPWLFVPRREVTLVGTLLALEGDAVRIGGKEGREWVVPRASVARWDVSVGKIPAPVSPRRRLGGALGLAVGGLGAILLGSPEPVLVGVAGLGTGALAGGVVPALADQWAPVEEPR